MKPCIFLDIDGVINPHRRKKSYQLDYNLPHILAKVTFNKMGYRHH